MKTQAGRGGVVILGLAMAGLLSLLTIGIGEEGRAESGDVESRAVPGRQAPIQNLPLQPLPQARQLPGLPQTWDALWDVTWKRAAYYYRIQAAPSTLQDPTCQGNLGFDVLVKNTIQAVALKKHGDATRFMGQFQDRSLCLTREGARGLEFALAMYVHRAVTVLPPQQAQLAVTGVMNLGMQAFDQLQYTGQSWWLPMINIDYGRIQPLMAAYPRQELGLWIYDFDRGMLVQNGLQDGIDRLLWSMQRLDNFGHGACNLLNMSATGFVCPDQTVPGGGSKGGAGSMMVPPGGLPTSGVSCVLDSVKASGVRGQFACMSKAIAGMTVDPRTSPADLAKQASQQPGIRDKFCALSEEAGGTAGTDKPKEPTTKEPGAWDKIKDAAGKVKDVVGSCVVRRFRQDAAGGLRCRAAGEPGGGRRSKRRSPDASAKRRAPDLRRYRRYRGVLQAARRPGHD